MDKETSTTARRRILREVTRSADKGVVVIGLIQVSERQTRSGL